MRRKGVANMLYKQRALVYVNQGGVYRFTRNGDQKVLVVVSNDDMNIHRSTIMVCPITKSAKNKELEDYDAIGKVQYISNGIMYTIHCDEVQPIERKYLNSGTKVFNLSRSLMDNIFTEINSMFIGHATEMDFEEVSEDSVNKVEFINDTLADKIAEEEIMTKVAEAPAPVKKNLPHASIKKPIIVVNNDLSAKLASVAKEIKEESKPEKISDNDFMLMYCECDSTESKQQFAKQSNMSMTALQSKINLIGHKNIDSWSEDKKIQFLIDYETCKKNKSLEEIPPKYYITTGQAARLYNKLI